MKELLADKLWADCRTPAAANGGGSRVLLEQMRGAGVPMSGSTSGFRSTPAWRPCACALCAPAGAPILDTSSLREIEWKELKPTGKTLGKGSFGAVTLYDWPRCVMRVAVKELCDSPAELHASDILRLRREAALQSRLMHDNIVRVYGLAVDKVGGGRYGLVMKPFAGSLASALPTLPLHTRVSAVKQLAAGLAYLHSESTVHGDIKPQNVLMDEAARQFAVADFGFAGLRTGLHSSRTTDAGATYKGAGTPAFMAPELFKEDERTGAPLHGPSKAADTYAFAITAWCALAQSAAPYPARDAGGLPVIPARRVPRGMRPDLAALEAACPGMPVAVPALLQECWAADKSARPTMASALQRFAEATDAWAGAEAGSIPRAAAPTPAPREDPAADPAPAPAQVPAPPLVPVERHAEAPSAAVEHTPVRAPRPAPAVAGGGGSDAGIRSGAAAAAAATFTGPACGDGSPDMRFKANKEAAAAAGMSEADFKERAKPAGTPIRVGSSDSGAGASGGGGAPATPTSFPGPACKDGSPNMSNKANKDAAAAAGMTPDQFKSLFSAKP